METLNLLNTDTLEELIPELDLFSTSLFNFEHFSEVTVKSNLLETKDTNSSISSTTSYLSTATSKEPEEDKKKRNTAASARFRVKKKQREQEMELAVRELTLKIQGYNDRINQLEVENSYLKGLVLEKNEKKSDDLLQSIRLKSLTN